MKKLPDGFDQFTENLLTEIEPVEGYLAPNEIRFLALMAAVPTADGEILEIGSFKGKSTVILAKAAALAGDGIVNAVDPMTAPSETDPDLRGDESSLADFRRNIESQGVADRINFHQAFSFDLAKTWDKPLRLLWIDGDHTYMGTRLDFEGFAPHLTDKGIVAIHDVLHEFDGGVRVMMEHILLSPNFGACGFCGSIAWAQYLADEKEALKYRDEKLKLYKKLARLIPYVVMRKSGVKGLEKKRYKLLRTLVPHGRVDPAKWIDEVC
jgi:predicted O-methyltransferase YrrM